jgi:hypothetical protein
MDTSETTTRSSIGAAAANDLRNNQKKFKHLVPIRVSIVNTLFALQYWALTRARLLTPIPPARSNA